ncbi:MAG: T9SS type A sorting domain-containing protein [candidate division Zixibacteria bacterium]
MTKPTIAKLSIPLVAILFVTVFAHSNYTGYSGAPGSNGSCSNSCHRQYSFVPNITVTGFPEVYEPETQYTIAVAHESGSTINQFNASVRIGEGSENAGVLAEGINTAIYDTPNETNGAHWNSADIDSGTFIWTSPPTGTGEVRLYWAGLQGTRAWGADTQIVLIASDAQLDIEYHPGTPTSFSMAQNYPNPFNGETIVEISVAEAGRVDFIITNILGQLVYEWRETVEQPGTVSIRWDGHKSDDSELPSGIYFYRLTSKAGTITKKMMLLR